MQHISVLISDNLLLYYPDCYDQTLSTQLQSYEKNKKSLLDGEKKDNR